MRALTWSVSRRRAAALTLGTAVLLSVLAFLIPAPQSTFDSSVTGLPDSYQSVQVEQLQASLPSADVQPAVVVYSRDDGAALSQADQEAITAGSAALAELAVGGRTSPLQLSPEAAVGIVAVPLNTADGNDAVVEQVTAVRAAAADGAPSGVVAQVTGGPAFTADVSAAFDGADVKLLIATVIVVALLLLITYRSPILWLIPLIVVAATEQVALHLVDVVLPRLDLVPDGATVGITSVLVFGAATDYALLLIARYREELRAVESRFTAMRRAVSRTAEAILASGFTVVLAVLTLLLATIAGNRALAVAASLGVLLAMAATLFVLPAALVLFDRWVFWPLTPRVGSPDRQGRVWGRLGQVVARHPGLTAAGAVVILLAMATGALGAKVGLAQTEAFRVKPESVLAAQTLARGFPAGQSNPVVVMTTPAAVDEVLAAVQTVDGVASAQAGESTADLAQVDVVLTPAPGTEESDEAIRALRTTLGDVPDSGPAALPAAVVGGTDASALDVSDAYDRDQRVIIPTILLLVGLVLVLLLRGLVAPLLLVLTVVVSYAASVGASWLVITGVLGFPALDSAVLLLSFLFLVALGVDYNIFLVTRAREDAATMGTRGGMLNALRLTGGVITSAGILLAAVFAVLGVLPIVVLTQIGVIVCVGVLLDTLLVRTVLVPALAMLLGDRFWWPGRPASAPTGPASGQLSRETPGVSHQI